MTRRATKSGLRCTRIGSRLLCSLTDVARVAGVHRNALYQAARREKMPVTTVFGVPVTTKAAAVGYLSRHAGRAARVTVKKEKKR